MSYVLPLIIILVYLKGYYDMFSSREPAVFLFWMLVAVAFLLLVISFSLRAGKRAGQKKQASIYIGYLCYNKMPGIKVPGYDTGGIR